jgi:hypothetical protein
MKRGKPKNDPEQHATHLIEPLSEIFLIPRA